MRREDVVAFAKRDWARLHDAKRTVARLPLDRSIAVADALRLHVARFAGAGLEAERAADLDNHVRLKRLIDAASAHLVGR